MKALILNSGKGSRMGDLTKTHPKCMTEIASMETIISRQLRQVAEQGISEVIITTGPFEEKLIHYVESLGLPLSYTFVRNPNYENTNYIYSMYLAKKYLEDTDILLLHGDLVVENDVFFSFCETEGSLMAGSKTKELPEKDFKAVVENDRIQKIGISYFEQAFAAQPLYKFEKEDFAKIKYIYIANKVRLKEFINIEAQIDELMLENIYNDYFFGSDLESLYYLSENYKKMVEIYLKIDAQEDCQVPYEELPIYFYSLKRLNKFDKLEKSFEKALKFKNEEIEDVKNGEFKREWTKSEKKEEIREIKRQIKNLKAEYEKILKTDYKPEVKIYPKFLYDCFLIDCPRHQKLDK